MGLGSDISTIAQCIITETWRLRNPLHMKNRP